MKGAQEVRMERKAKKAEIDQKKAENVEIIESLVLDRFRDLNETTITVWEYRGFFVIGDDETDIPFDEQSKAEIYKDFNNEDGYQAVTFEMYDKQVALKISIID